MLAFRRSGLAALCFATLALVPSRAPAQERAEADLPTPGADETFRRGIAFEVNVLWPFVPGTFELRLMIPVVRPDRRDWRGELVTGAYADYASWIVRGDDSGKARNLSAKVGYRQFFVDGLHIEVSANLGWRHESGRPPSGATTYPADIDGFQTRLWMMAGYEHEFSPAVYANARGGLGINVVRTDDYAYLEKSVVPGADVNVGFRF